MLDHLYVFRAGFDQYKIGVSKKVDSRLKHLQTGNPEKIEIIHTLESRHAYTIEKILHQKLDQFRLQGEWFELSPAVAEWLSRFIFTLEQVDRMFEEAGFPNFWKPDPNLMIAVINNQAKRCG